MTSDLWYRTLDSKRRLFLPPVWVRRLGDEFKIAAAPDHSLLILPASEPVPRGTASTARGVVWNRIMIPLPLADWAGLLPGADCVIYTDGVGLRVESAETWREAVERGRRCEVMG